jgi:hypothetical protein
LDLAARAAKKMRERIAFRGLKPHAKGTLPLRGSFTAVAAGGRVIR